MVPNFVNQFLRMVDSRTGDLLHKKGQENRKEGVKRYKDSVV